VRGAGYINANALRLRADVLKLFPDHFRFAQPGHFLKQFRLVNENQGADQTIRLLANGQGAVFDARQM
jgi:hypothetical protein